MPINKKYHPDYRALYPGVEITPAVLAALNRSDRKIEYIEWELKHNRVRRNKAGEVVKVTPARESSLEELQEMSREFRGLAPSAEDTFLAQEQRRALRRSLATLNERERALIQAIFQDDLTEQEYAETLGITQQNVHKQKRRVLCKLLKIVKF